MKYKNVFEFDDQYGMFGVANDMADIEFIIFFGDNKGIDKAMRIVDEAIDKWISANEKEYDKGYIEVAQDALNENGYFDVIFYDIVRQE